MKMNGWLILDKHIGISSNFALTQIKKILPKGIRIGHAGTLDPLAQGVLPIAIGEATKTVQYLMEANKEYEFDVCWGSETTTGDKEGEIVANGGHMPELEDLNAVIPQFLGDILQTPPIYSAIKINGQPAYKLAREGIEVELKQRLIKVKSLEVLSHESGISRLRVHCGKGTYVRSLAVDIAKKLGSLAHVTYLNRTRVGNFLLKDAITLAKLLKMMHNVEADLQLLPVDFGLGDILAIDVNADQTKALRNGLSIFLPDYSNSSTIVAQVIYGGILQALVSVSEGVVKPLRVFNL